MNKFRDKNTINWIITSDSIAQFDKKKNSGRKFCLKNEEKNAKQDFTTALSLLEKSTELFNYF